MAGMFFLLLASYSFGQAKLTASSNVTSVGQNTAFQVTYSLSGGSAESFSAPAFSNFSVVGTSRTSGGGMTIIVNGKMVQSGNGEEKWIYTLVPKAEGKFTIEPAKVKVSGQWISSNSLSIEVTKAAAGKNSNQSQTQDQGQTAEAGNDDLFVKAQVDKTSALQGEQITVTYKIYTRIPVTQYAINKLSSFNGFWTHDLLDPNSNPKQYVETYNGSKYTVAEIRKVALFAQKSGTLTLEPLEVECIAQVQVQGGNSIFDKFFNDPFFNDPFFKNQFSSVQNVKKKLKSNAVTLTISPLPVASKPSPFSGAVGTFTFTGEADRTRVKQNEAITIKYTVNGSGNINLIEMPQPEFPSDFEVYDPQITDNISVSGGKVSGSRTWEYLVIPRNEGKFSIKPIPFSYYDPKLKAYRTLTVPAMDFIIDKGTGGSSTVYGGNNKQDVEYIGSDVRYMDLRVLPLRPVGWFFFNSLWYYLLLSLPLLAFVAFALIWRRRLKIRSNTALLKNMRATGVARKRLKRSHHHMLKGEHEMFYIELSKALWGYVSDKFTIPLAELSLENVRTALAARDIPDELLDRLIDILNQCEYARFAPADPALSPESMYTSASGMITEIEAKIK
jgi:hypothetical protein